MRKLFLRKRVVALAVAATMAFSVVSVPAGTQYVAAAEAESATEAFYKSDAKVTTDKLDLPEEDWSDAKPIIAYDESVSGVNTTDNFTMTAEVTLDEAGYTSLATEGDYLKLQGVVKLGEKWTWTDSQVIPYLEQKNFEKSGDVYKTTIEIPFSDKTADALKGIYFVVVAQGFEGTITFSNVALTAVETAATKEELVYTGTKTVDQEVDFSALAEENWDDKPIVTYETDIAGTTIGDKLVVRGTATVDKALYESLATEGSYVKLQSVVKVGDEWTWTQGGDYPYLDQAAFTEKDGVYTADFEVKYSDITGGDVHEVIFVIVGVGAKGTVSFSNVTINNVISAETVLPEMDPTVVADFATGITGWVPESGWDYSAGKADLTSKKEETTIAWDETMQALKVSLDYTQDSASTWSEAKVKLTGATCDVSAYNLLTYDIIHPADFTDYKVKVFANNADSATTIIEKEGILETTDLESGMKKTTVMVKFSPNAEKITDLTLGTIGVNSSFKGDIYIDNVVFSQYDASADFVEITSTPSADASKADTSEMPTEVKLADADAGASTKALYAYLQGLDNVNQVLFGHQNDTYKNVIASKDVYSDVKDVTGSISGVVGMDSLDLTGVQIGLEDVDAAIKQSVEYAKAAAAEGAIITLSTHMPNMSNAKIVATPDGTRPYDFSACDFSESKDLSNNCSQEVLPGGKYNAQFTAYLDIIADYAKGLGDIPVLFRPFHENNGGWFWWGSATTDKETYKALYRYTVDYLTEAGVHNFIYIYSPNGPISSEDKYLERYPGDDYVDILAFDYYDDYNSYPATYSDAFFTNLESTCNVVNKLASEKGKIASIAETGVRVMKADGSDSEGLLVKNNPIVGKNWYKQVNDIAQKTNMPYFLVWSNFSDTNFYVPYKYNETKGQELINEFIDFYNEDSSVFANGTNFYDAAEDTVVSNTENTSVSGYFVNVFNNAAYTSAATLQAKVKNASEAQMIIKDETSGNQRVLEAKVNANGFYQAELTDEVLKEIGTTDRATITLVAGGKDIVTVKNISLGKEKETLPKNTIDNFELYYGDNDLLSGVFSENSAAGCASEFVLDENNKAKGNYGGAFNYTLKTSGPEVWTGCKMTLPNTDYSEYNALSMWVKPDGLGQKLVVQLVSNGEDFEVFLNDFVAKTEARYITIPFSEMKGKNGGTFDPSNITNFAIWCNSVGAIDTSSTIVFDDIMFKNVDMSSLDLNDGYSISTRPVSDIATEEEVPDSIAAPTSIKATKNTNSAITLSWKDDRATAYEVYRYNESKGAYVKVTTVYKPTFTDKNKKAATTYKYKIRAYKVIGDTTVYSGDSAVFTTATAPKKVTTLKVKSTKKKVATVTWKKAANVSGYELYRATSKKGKYKKVKTIKMSNLKSTSTLKLKGSTITFTNNKLKAGKKYYYKVRAYKTVGSKKIYSTYSSIKSVKVKK